MLNRRNGIYYTPSGLAEYVATPLVTRDNISILDPSYGEGALLLAAERVFERSGSLKSISLFGCDTKPVNGLLKHLPAANLKEIDFFDFSTQNKFQAILMNPPYVRHHIQDSKKIDKYRTRFPELKILNRNADLWAYFILKALLHLEENGSIGAVLPWAILQADYARPIRALLMEKFNQIKAVALSKKYFQSADERVVVLWLTGYGQNCKSISIAASKGIESKTVFKTLPQHIWTSNKVFYSDADDIDHLLITARRQYGFTEFSNHADVKIGIVTGAVDYFITSKSEAKLKGFADSRLVPVLTTGKEFSQYLKKGKKVLKVLISLRANDYLKYRKFIKEGVDQEIQFRAHSQKRNPWYTVKVGNAPDAIFHYRVVDTPFLIPNNDKVQCTNSLHRIYFKNLTETEKKWITVSILSTLSQLSIEFNSKNYGRGILKIEPKSLKSALVLKKNDPMINPIYNKIIQLLSQAKKREAVEVASNFIYRYLKLPSNFQTDVASALTNLHSLR